jgi:hypothetical protein
MPEFGYTVYSVDIIRSIYLWMSWLCGKFKGIVLLRHLYVQNHFAMHPRDSGSVILLLHVLMTVPTHNISWMRAQLEAN